MLDIMRRQKDSIVIKIVFVVIVLSFIGTMFLVWGEGRSGLGKGNKPFAAKVDGTKISLEQYQNSYQRIRSTYQQIYGQSLSPEIEKVLNLKKVALDGLVDNLLISKEAKNLGITVSMDDVSKEISQMPVFQKDGVFSFDLYKQLLNSNKITAKDFEESQKSDLVLKKTRQSIKDKVVISDEDALAVYKKERDKINLEYTAYSPAALMNDVTASDAELSEYMEKNKTEFMTEAKSAISYILIDPLKQSSGIQVTEDEIQSYYQKNIDKFQGKDGSIPLKEISEKVKNAAIRQKAAKQSFELAADTLYKNIKSGDLKVIATSLKLPVQDTQSFAASAPPAQLIGETLLVKKVFELKKGELGGPVETAKGIYIIKINDRKDAALPPLAEIKEKVAVKVKAKKATELAKKKAEDETKNIAAKGIASPKTTGLFSFSAKGEIPAIGNSPDMMEAAFKLTAAAPAPSTPVQIANTWFVFRLKERTEAPKDEFEKSKADIKKKILPKKQDEAVEKWLKDLRAKAKIEINEALIANK